MTQLTLIFSDSVCMFGEPLWGRAHPLCDAHGREMAEQFAALVASGHFDAEGFTAAERQKAGR